MITSGFTYIAILIVLAASLVGLQNKTKSKIFTIIPPVVLLYILCMLFCSLNLWDLQSTKEAYNLLKNNVLYAMIFLMMLRCDVRKIAKLGPKMLGGFLIASVSIGIGFIVAFALFNNILGENAWKALSALCGSWMGGSGNMVAIQAALNISEGDMAYALVIDSIDYSIWVMFLLWSINFTSKFNKWTKANTAILDEVCSRLEMEEEQEKGSISFESLFVVLALGLLSSAICQNIGVFINNWLPFLDKATWTVIVITIIGLIGGVTSLGKIAGSLEIANIFLYTVIALLASRANLSELSNAPIWILTGFVVLIIHAIVMLIFAKIFKLDLFTCAIASLANIGGTASAPILAGAYNPAFLSVGILMALVGYVIGTGGGLIVARLMQLFV